MNDKQFEHIIKNKLSGFQSKETPDWELFLEKKTIADAADTKDALDEQVREALDGYTVTSQPQWEAFKAYQNSQNAETSEDNNFDTAIKTGLVAAVITAVPQWSAFKDHQATAASEADQSFDDELVSKLEDYQTTAEPQWEAFQEFQTQYEGQLADDNFDARIQDELEGYESPSEPDWQAFLDSKFDAAIDDKVGDYETSDKPQWEEFLKKKRANDGVMQDAAFDNTVLGRLGQQSVKYNSEHWLLLKARLQKIAYFRKQIFSYKTLEMIFVSLLLFTIGNHFYLIDQPREFAETEIQTTQETTIPSQHKEDLNTGTSDVTDSAVLAENQPVRTVNNATRSTSADLGLSQAGTFRENSQNSFSETPSVGGGLATGAASDGAANNGVETTITKTLVAQSNTNAATTARTSLDALSILSHNATEGLSLAYNTSLPEVYALSYIDYQKKKTYTNEGHWLHVVNAIDNAYITTPQNLELGLGRTTQEQNGYSLELLYSKAYKRTEFEIGLGYSLLNYKPFDNGAQTYTTADGSVRSTTFERIKLDFVSVPLNAKYKFVSNGRWSVFGALGLSNDFLFLSTYEIDDQLEFRAPTPLPGPPPPPNQEDLPFFYNREFTVGLLGGTPELPTFVEYRTKNNFYTLRGTISIGAERNISDQFAAYVRATYYHTLYNDRIGPYNDRINKANFGMGFKMRL